MNTREASQYLAEKYAVTVSPSIVGKWLLAGHIEAEKNGGRWAVTESAIDDAVEKAIVPRKAGRQRKFSKEQRQAMRNMCEKHTLKEVANHFGCDQSYVSLIRRGLR